MRRHTFIVLGITAAVFGLAPLTQAQSDVPSSNQNSVTLSGESLRTVERRSLSSDYRSFFNNNSSSMTQDEAGVNSPDSGFAINDRLRIVVGDTLTSSDPLDLFPAVGEQGDVQRLKLQVPLSE